MTFDPPKIQHPPSVSARLVRGLRPFRRLRGWSRLASMLVAEQNPGPFVVRNGGSFFAGDMASFIEREAYLRGGFETELIDAFLALIPRDRRGTILDVGANCGSHTIRFAREFDTVHAFEPNPLMLPRLRRNVDLNRLDNVHIHPVGLADAPASLPFYAGDHFNGGMGTFSSVEQYDIELKQTATLRVEKADDYLPSRLSGPVDAMKIDVQGFEPNVLRGASRLLEAHRPFVWLEVGEGTLAELSGREAFLALFPYEIRLLRFARTGAVLWKVGLVEHDPGNLVAGDYVACPV